MSPDVAGVQLAVIVPAYRCAATLHASLAGLLASEFPRHAWELVVVDDGSGDETAAVATRLADRVVTISDGPLGPAHARNAGAATTRAPILVFVDADVVVATTTLRQFAAHLRDDSRSGAVGLLRDLLVVRLVLASLPATGWSGAARRKRTHSARRSGPTGTGGAGSVRARKGSGSLAPPWL